jgi:hypothetical protein
MNNFVLYSQFLADPASPSMESIIFFFQDTLSFVYVIGFFCFLDFISLYLDFLQ